MTACPFKKHCMSFQKTLHVLSKNTACPFKKHCMSFQKNIDEAGFRG
jgi:hypothetical protein